MIPTKYNFANRSNKIIFLLIFILLVTIAMVPFLINPLAKTLIKQQAATIFEDKLTIGAVNVSFWTGTVIKLNQVVLAQPPRYGPGSLLKAGSIRVRVSLWPLLKKQLIVRDVTVLNPEIHLIQSRNGELNTDYYLMKLAVKPGSRLMPGDPVQLNLFTVQNGKIIIDSPNLSERQPALQFAGCNLSLRNLELPNRGRMASPFTFTGLLGTVRQAKVKADGTGVFGAGSLSFAMKSRIDQLFLPDYAYLGPPSSLVIENGTADITSDARCNNNQLSSQHHIELTHLKVTARKSNSLTEILLGVPANAFIKVIADQKGAFDFEFAITRPFNDLKARPKFKVIRAINKGIRSKLALPQATAPVGTGLKKAVNVFANIIKKSFPLKK